MPDRWQADNGLSTNAVAGFCAFMLQVLEREQPQAIVFAFDESLGSGFRHQLYPGYKARRALPDEALAFQLDACRTLTGLLGFAHLASDEYEADDLLASAAVRARAVGMRVHILSRDKDLGQILQSDDDRIQDYPSGEALSPADFRDRYGVHPERFADFLALTGDAVDDIPGVPGIGPRTALHLIDHCSDLADLIARVDEVATLPIRGAAKVAQRLRTHAPSLALSRRLTGLVTDIPLSTLDWRRRSADTRALRDFFARMGLGSRSLQRALRVVSGFGEDAA